MSSDENGVKNHQSMIENDDWEVTKEIYANSIIQEGVIEIEISVHDMLGIRRRRPLEVKYDDIIDPTYEFLVLSQSMQPPTVRLEFLYDDCDSTDNIGDEIMNSLSSVNITIKFIPSEFSLMQVSPLVSASITPKEEHTNNNVNVHGQWLEWLQLNADKLLEETQMSFSICDFIEHQALSFFNIIHKDDALGYSAILFQDVVPSLVSSWNQYTASFSTRKVVSTKRRSKANMSLEDYAKCTIQNHWKEWVSFQCPICFDTCKCDKGVEQPCFHFLCTSCAEAYIQTKISDLDQLRYSPFMCPIVSCKQGMKIKSGDYPVSDDDRKKIFEWKYNLTYPYSHMLTQCPRKGCKSHGMRKVSSTLLETMVFCDQCNVAFCELCIKKYKGRECKDEHDCHVCDEKLVLKLCRRYRNASNEIKIKAEEKWHWLKDYASSREEDISATLWVSENASRCPTCKTAIERIEGCFHMHCTMCGTHFCYECGDEIHYPFYGTHHCWEEGNLFNDINDY